MTGPRSIVSWWIAVACAAMSTGSARAQSVSAADVTVSKAWVREASVAQGSTGAYFAITNTAPKATALLAVRSSVARTAELHRMVMKKANPKMAMPGMAAASMMTMDKVASVAVPAGATVELAPGAYHVMLFKLARPLHVGDTVDLHLTFEGGVTKTVTAKVLSRAATGYQP